MFSLRVVLFGKLYCMKWDFTGVSKREIVICATREESATICSRNLRPNANRRVSKLQREAKRICSSCKWIRKFYFLWESFLWLASRSYLPIEKGKLTEDNTNKTPLKKVLLLTGLRRRNRNDATYLSRYYLKQFQCANNGSLLWFTFAIFQSPDRTSWKLHR